MLPLAARGGCWGGALWCWFCDDTWILMNGLLPYNLSLRALSNKLGQGEEHQTWHYYLYHLSKIGVIEIVLSILSILFIYLFFLSAMWQTPTGNWESWNRNSMSFKITQPQQTDKQIKQMVSHRDDLNIRCSAHWNGWMVIGECWTRMRFIQCSQQDQLSLTPKPIFSLALS